MANDPIDVKPQEQILEDAGLRSDHPGNESKIMRVQNELTGNQTHQQVRLERAINGFRQDIQSYTTWSKTLTGILVLLTLAMAGMTAVNVWVAIA